MRNFKKVPEFYDCGNCKRSLAVEGYKTHARPNQDNNEVHVHYSPNDLPFTLMCTCGHYTVVVDELPYQP